MIILGIDPGTTTIGFAFLEKEWTSIRVIEYGVITTPPKSSLAEKLILIHSDISELLDVYNPQIVGIEKLFFVRNVTNGIDVAHARGILLHAFAVRGMIIEEFTPLQIKQWIAGNGHAKKTQIQKAIQMILKLSEIPKPDDAADALAVAYITALGIRIKK